MTGRPLHAALLPPGDQVRELLAAALDGSGPALAAVDPGLPPPRLRELLSTLAPSAVITPDGVTRRHGGEPVLDGTALVVVTSGSTGAPKAAELSAAALLASARASLSRIGARRGERWLCCLPAAHIAGIQVLVRSMLAGAPPLVCAPSDTAAIAAAADAGCAHVALVPTQLRRLLDTGRSRGADVSPGPSGPSGPSHGPSGLSGLRTILLGGAAPPWRQRSRRIQRCARPWCSACRMRCGANGSPWSSCRPTRTTRRRPPSSVVMSRGAWLALRRHGRF